MAKLTIESDGQNIGPIELGDPLYCQQYSSTYDGFIGSIKELKSRDVEDGKKVFDIAFESGHNMQVCVNGNEMDWILDAKMIQVDLYNMVIHKIK